MLQQALLADTNDAAETAFLQHKSLLSHKMHAHTCIWAETWARVWDSVSTGKGPLSAAASSVLTTQARLASKNESSICEEHKWILARLATFTAELAKLAKLSWPRAVPQI